MTATHKDASTVIMQFKLVYKWRTKTSHAFCRLCYISSTIFRWVFWTVASDRVVLNRCEHTYYSCSCSFEVSILTPLFHVQFTGALLNDSYDISFEISIWPICICFVCTFLCWRGFVFGFCFRMLRFLIVCQIQWC